MIASTLEFASLIRNIATLGGMIASAAPGADAERLDTLLAR